MASLVIALGNPGGEYAHTRHNVGWDCLEEVERHGRFSRERREGPARVLEGVIEGYEFILARPQTFMNVSGKAGLHLTNKFGIAPQDVIVVHDDIDLPLGRIRIRRGGSAGGQNGVKSLIESWRNPEFVRVKIGIGRPGEKDDVIDYVLDRFHPDERKAIAPVITRAADAVIAIVREGLDAAMNQYNRQ